MFFFPRQVKLAKVASGIIGLWVVAWTPYAVVALLGIFSQKAIITPFVSMIPALFCKTAACLDPYVYALSHPRFKNELRKRMLLCRPKFLNGLRNVAAQGFSVSTFSEIREERELSDVQGWDTNDPSFSSLGPLLQKNVSYSSHPTVSDRRRSKASINSPGSKSLISPTGTEIYPRSTISTYSFRKTSRSFKDRRDTLEKSRKLDQMTELQTTVLIEFPRGGIPKAPFSHSCSFGNGVEELSKKHSQNPARVWRSSQLLKEDSTKAVCPNNNSTEEHYRDESDVPKLSEGNKVDYRSYLPITLLSIPPVSSACRLSMVRAKGRSNSLPNMTQSNGDKKEDGGKFPKNVLLQLFYGKLLYNGRKNKSHSSLYQDERRLGNV
ncbi:Opsin Rh5-like [Homarus americanus]|uniref:Opsin Rh5-like n=1 Tax=Homarus americanus TaxID=6706 RepID=A0A8J5MKT0_HOMAM|nr:Opsin Rh5-like [Homarus americanus]